MIQRLYIRNYAIIDEVSMHFSEKLNIITGETGAGKSIILGALGLIMGNRAEVRQLKASDKKCVIEAVFDVFHYDLKAFFEERELDYDTEVMIRREIAPSGKSRAFVNDTPVRLELLKEVTGKLLDLHQQFDTLDINTENFQLEMVDAMAKNQPFLTTYRGLFEEFQTNKRRLARLTDEKRKAEQELDFVSFQLEELATADFQAGEQTELEQELDILANAEGIKMTLGKSFRVLSDDEQAVVSQLQMLSNEVSGLAKFYPELKEILERFDGAIIELQEIANDFERIADDTEYDPERIETISERLDLMYRLQKKHHVSSVEKLLEIQAALQQKVDNYSNSEEAIEALTATIAAQEIDLRKEAEVLSKRRKAVIPNFETEIHKMLTQLSMPHARLKIECRPLANLNGMGLDEVAFMFAANKGSKLDYIRNVASGGEIARLTLCTKSLVADALTLPTLIFDEIDTGVSGDVALKMGHILRDLANRHQVISITHTPQIAARADHHYFVYKYVQGETTISSVKLLEKEERVKEIATMLSGNPPSASALENAKELINGK